MIKQEHMDDSTKKVGNIMTGEEVVWTLLSLREYLLGLITEVDRRHDEKTYALTRLVEERERMQLERFEDARRDVRVAFMNAKEATAAALAAAERAVLKAEASSESRFASVNEFRATLSDQQRMLMPRAETEVQLKALADKIEQLAAGARERSQVVSNLMATTTGHRDGVVGGWGMAVGIMGVVIAIITIVIAIVKH